MTVRLKRHVLKGVTDHCGKLVSEERRLEEPPKYSVEIPFRSSKRSTSVSLITYNEEELLPQCLDYCLSLRQVGEICVVDSFSTDNTVEILKDYSKKAESKNIHLKFYQREFDNFQNQRNKCLELCSLKWILYIDADETYTENLNELLPALEFMPTINAVRIGTIMIFPDSQHFIKKRFLDPHIRIWRRGFAQFNGVIHERLRDKQNRDLHVTRAPDILHADHLIPKCFMLHHQLLKTDKSLIEKCERWEQIGAISNSCRWGKKLTKSFWIDEKGKEWDILPIENL